MREMLHCQLEYVAFLRRHARLWGGRRFAVVMLFSLLGGFNLDSELVMMEFQCTLLCSPRLLLQVTFSIRQLFR